MIDYVFYTLVCLCLVILQTAILPYITYFNNCYDLLIPFILYMAFFRPVFESILVALTIGLVMDSITGGPFGIFISIYFWIVVGIRWGMQFFHSGTVVMLPLAIAACVLIENLALLAITAVILKEQIFPAGVAGLVSWQILWAAISGPFVFMFIKFIHTGLNAWLEEVYLGRNSHGL
ncbi:MAG: hypothetical protein JRI99_00620 [Deltaproteobacteria bacterium]|nr:hypothetical protein [Deltaproteobacteria bacterium]